ncbi:FAD dependent oxidoreductase [Dactylonectria macrodidyma]|uniref:FAD dependent oxidoreductase n=1 Tax=Dactylonectria macrodidyma TaxID=307937 RepID=A0A9P9DW30_9HYPO|nr:FAD dependent oxidoreductase [Dactylonectria macrodidyma]
MTTWMSNENWSGPGQMSVDEVQQTKAPNPAEFPETPQNSLSYWIRNFPIDFEDEWVNVQPPQTVDVAIIGSGITGASTAFNFSESAPDLKVAIFDARGLCTGATGRNGGLIGRPESYDIRALATQLGVEEAVRLRQLTRINREMMVAVIEELGCGESVDLNLTGSMVVFHSQEEREAFISDLEFSREHGLKTEGYLIDCEEVVKRIDMSPSTAHFGAACLDKCGSFYPRKFVATLLKHALDRMKHLSLHPFTPVWKVDYDKAQEFGYIVTTSKGVVRARTVLHATNGYGSHLVPALQRPDGVFGCSAHMIGVQPNVEEPIPQMKYGVGYRECFHWMLQRPNAGPFLYGLWKAERIGRYNDTVTLDDNNGIRKEMFSFLEDAYPNKFKNLTAEKDVPYDWQGVQGFTQSGSSIVGRPEPERSGEFVAVGFNGEGMGRCFACASVISDAILAELKGDKNWQAPEWFPHSYRRNL